MTERNRKIAVQIILLILTAGFAFGLGYLARGVGEIAPIIIEKNG